MELVDEPQQLAAQPGTALVVEVGRFLASEPDRTLEPTLEKTHRLQKRRLPDPDGPSKSDNLSGRDRRSRRAGPRW